MTAVMISSDNGQAVPDAVGVSGHGQPRSAGRTDRGLTAMAVAGVTALTGLGWVLSYAALRQLALSAGMAEWAATLWPLCIDLFVFVATLAAIVDRRRGRPTTYAWTLAALYSAATVAGNVTAAGPDHLAQAVHAMPAVTMVLAWHLLSRFAGADGHPPEARVRSENGVSAVSGRGRTVQAVRPVSNRRRVRPGADQVAACVAELEAAGQRPTGDAVAARFGVSDRTGRRLLTDVRSVRAAGSMG
jgi:hypothetical protein